MAEIEHVNTRMVPIAGNGQQLAKVGSDGRNQFLIVQFP